MARAGTNHRGGRPKGAKSEKTLERERVLEALRQRAMKASDVLFNAQLGLAVGSQYLYKIEKELIKGPKGGTTYRKLPPKLVTDQSEIESYLEGEITNGDEDNDQDPNATYYFITTKDPENSAIESLLNRTFGKPKEILEVSTEVSLKMDV